MSTLPNKTTVDAQSMPVVVSADAEQPPRVKRWTREEYYRLGEQGWFRDERVELIDGEICLVSPQSFEHGYAIHAIFQLLSSIFGSDCTVRMQIPLIGNPVSEPEPDISVVRGTWQDYSDHPTTALLVIEVSHSTLKFDQGPKTNLYASMDVPDYWVLDLENRQLLVFREPIADGEARFGHRYAQCETIAADGSVTPLEKPNATFAVADMLPPQSSK